MDVNSILNWFSENIIAIISPLIAIYGTNVYAERRAINEAKAKLVLEETRADEQAKLNSSKVQESTIERLEVKVQTIEKKSDKNEIIAAINSTRTDLTGEIQSVKTELTAEINSTRTDLTGEIQSVKTELTAEINSTRTDLTGEIQSVKTEVQNLRSDCQANTAAIQKLETKTNLITDKQDSIILELRQAKVLKKTKPLRRSI